MQINLRPSLRSGMRLNARYCQSVLLTLAALASSIAWSISRRRDRQNERPVTLRAEVRPARFTEPEMSAEPDSLVPPNIHAR